MTVFLSSSSSSSKVPRDSLGDFYLFLLIFRVFLKISSKRARGRGRGWGRGGGGGGGGGGG